MPGRLLYVDCVAGVAGDMLLGALIDAGADADGVRAGLGGLAVDGLRLELSRTQRHGIAAARLEVIAPVEDTPRRWLQVRELIDTAGLPERARVRAQETFRRLAEAEGAVHDVAPEDVHFHELGALDALADVCGVALALEDLGIERLVCSPLPAPRGFVDAAHGRLPLPAPATLELLKGAPLHGVDVSAELVTPTGAALVASLAEGYGPLPPMQLEAVGYGAGSGELAERPNLVRVLVGEWLGDRADAVVSLIETNLDDMAPELVPDAADAAFAAGALDVWTTPAQMKKGRPGLVISALARPEAERPVADAILRTTTALGLRIAHLERVELERDFEVVRVHGEPVRVKVGRLGGELLNLAPEHDDCMRVALGSGHTVKSVWAAALAAAEREVRR
ncbi:MAG: nickel pincer cofactor biosynthesis protein LarC [Thermoleophilaceae bacterium]|nr:nickel pincer cofactor biosynthesis protein LarC [Thermoleophilaceae bacterium]